MIDITVLLFMIHTVYSGCIIYMLFHRNVASNAVLAYASLVLFLMSSTCMLVAVCSGHFLKWLLVAECFRLLGIALSSRTLKYVHATK